MINEAIEKITNEMMRIDDPLAQMIEEHLTEKCSNDIIAAKLLSPSKSLKEIHRNIWEEAKKRKKGNGAFIPDAEIYHMIDVYYDIADPHEAVAAPKAVLAEETIDVMDLL